MRAFCFRLAADLGIWDVDGLMDRLPSPLLSEWIAFYSQQEEETTRDHLAQRAVSRLQNRP